MNRKKAPYMMAMIIVYRDKNLQTKKLLSRDILELFAIQWKKDSLQYISSKGIFDLNSL